jgi:uncharacterized membrane protein YdbT with pleckstrin-like domain
MAEPAGSPNNGGAAAPRGIIYETGERVLAVGRPFAWWVLLLALLMVVLVAAPVAAAQGQQTLSYAALAAGVVVLVFLIARYLEWTSRVWVLTDRRVIARSGILNRTQAAVLLERVQDASLTRPFLASMFADYGILHLETAGIHSDERVTEGLHEVAITGASRFYAQLTDALTPRR